MAELPNRDDLEARFARKFGKLARKHMREFRRFLGTPPDLANVPQTFWDKMQREVDAELYSILLLIFDDSALFHGWSGPDASLAAYGWAKNRAESFSSYWVDSTRTRLADGFDKITKPMDLPEETVEQARESSRLNPFNQESMIPTKPEVDDLLLKTFGPGRVTRIAVQETTRARSAGSESAVQELGLLSENDIWLNPADDVTCEICWPLIGKSRSGWIDAAPEGPPPTQSECHCRCAISYEVDRIRDGITKIPTWTPEEWRRYLRNPESMRRQTKSLDPFGPSFDVKAWYRIIPEAAEWRAHCRENGVDVANLSAFKSFNPQEARDEGGKWTVGGSSFQYHKPADFPHHEGIQSALSHGQQGHAENMAYHLGQAHQYDLLAKKDAESGHGTGAVYTLMGDRHRSLAADFQQRAETQRANQPLVDPNEKLRQQQTAARQKLQEMKLKDESAAESQEKMAGRFEKIGQTAQADHLRQAAKFNREHAEKLQKELASDQVSWVNNAHHQPAMGAKSAGSHKLPETDASVKVLSGPKATHRLKELLGLDWEPKHLASLVGAPPDSHCSLFDRGDGTVSISVTKEKPTKGSMPSIDATRTISVREGKPICHNDIFVVAKKLRGTGIGGTMLAAQIENMKQAGMSAIETYAARGEGYVGYKVWPKIGYDAPLAKSFIEDLQRSRQPEHVKSAKSIQDLYKSQEGIKYWEKHGEGTNMSIDLSDGNSPSFQRADRYVQKVKSKPTAMKSLSIAEDFDAADNVFSMDQLQMLDELTSSSHFPQNPKPTMKSFNSSEPRDADGKWTSSGSSHDATPGDKYVLRRTQNPDSDLRRGWSAWGGIYTDSPLDNPEVDNKLAESGKDVYDIINDLGEDDVHETDDGWEVNDTPQAKDAVAEWIDDNLGLDMRKDPTTGKWALRHHEGLSSYGLNAEHPDQAIKEGRHRVENGGQNYLVGGNTGINPVAYHHLGDDKYIFRVHHIGGQADS